MKQSSATPENSLLLTLEEISQLVSHSHDAAETLANIVQLIQRRFETEVCSVYLLEPGRGDLVLSATVGLQADSIGRVRMGLHEGLTGLVAEQLAPVMVEEAAVHPRFKYFPEAGEDPYHSFLGVPLVERGMLQGVLVVQTVERRTFSRDEIRMLVTVGSQLAPLVSEAQLLKQVTLAASSAGLTAQALPTGDGTRTLTGMPLSPGVGTGEVYISEQLDEHSDDVAPGSSNALEQALRLETALDAARQELSRLGERISSLLGEEHGVILQGQLMILQDRQIEQELQALIQTGATAERALRQVLAKYSAVFEKITNKYFQERVYDIKDVFRRIHWHLRPGHQTADAGTSRLVLVAQDVSVMDLFSVEPERLAAIVVEQGGPQSHAAILARSLGVPMVGRINAAEAGILAGRQLFVDGTSGIVTVNPDASRIWPAVTAPDVSRYGRLDGPLGRAAECEPTGQPGVPSVEANLNLPCEVAAAVEYGASGVGLFRSEFLFLARRTLPTEEEQVGIYRKLLSALGGRPVSIRTFDLRPDKLAHWSRMGAADATRLDWRLVLDSPPIQKLFHDQVRAILRAAAVGSARILVPFVNTTEQLAFIVETVEQAREELHREGWDFDRDVPLGIMIESAAAAEMVKSWSQQVDFFALGTNDLVASALGLDRDDAATQGLHDPLHPGVLRLIHSTVMGAHFAGRPITVCGEMAGDPTGACVLAALQVDRLSVAVHKLRSTQRALAEQASALPIPLAPQVIGLRTAAAVRELLHQIRMPSAS
jgi:phosphotransferase system enzyme I (PtsP)